ncbi:uncharacterized [Tachysurus ichikawai]
MLSGGIKFRNGRMDSPARDSNFNLSCRYRRMERVEVPNRCHVDAGDVQYVLTQIRSFQCSIRDCFCSQSNEGKRATCVTRCPAPQRPCVSSYPLPEERSAHTDTRTVSRTVTRTWTASRTAR